MLLTGKNPHGIQEAEVMPTAFYPILTPGDLDGIVAYLRSLTPVKNKVPDPVYKIALPHHVFPGAEKSYSQADLNDKLKRGFYLATIGHCMECHTPFAPPGGADFANSLGKGGRDFPGPWGVSKSRNITSHKTAGIGDWTDAEIKTAITQGKRKDGTPLKGPMGYQYYAKMTDADLDAVIAYLRTAPGQGIGPVFGPGGLRRGGGWRSPRPSIAAARGLYLSSFDWDRHTMPYRFRLLSAALAAVSLLLPQGARRPGARGAAFGRGAAHVLCADRQARGAGGRHGVRRQDGGEPQPADGRSVLPALLRASSSGRRSRPSSRSAPASSSIPPA